MPAAGAVPFASRRRLALLAGALCLAACQSGPERPPALAEAYAGPTTLNLRREINPRSPVAATVRHGDRLEIIQRRRRFFKVRDAAGHEGWTEEHLLLSRGEIERLKTFAGQVKGMPSQGEATTYDATSVHSEPTRLSPSFLTIKAGEKFDVIMREVAPRRAPVRPPLIPRPERAPRKASSPNRKAEKLAPPAPPPAPKAPPDWLDLSKTAAALEEPKPPAAPEPTDDWTLIRTASGECGWILSRRVVMGIPDEVAQYAEGRRITSYFRLGEVQDGDAVKPTWLWTTVEESLTAHDFDSFRVFVWSKRHHRYETAYIQRRLRGYFPVLAKPGAFSVCLEREDGTRRRRSYSFAGYQMRAAGDEPCDAVNLEHASDAQAAAPAPPPREPAPSLSARVKSRWQSLKGRWFGK